MFNYDDIGGKIKSLAKVSFIIEAISAVITGLAILVNGNGWGILIAIAGPFAAWVGSWVLYGFGQLIDNTTPHCTATPSEYEDESQNNTATPHIEINSESRPSFDINSNESKLSLPKQDQYVQAICPHCHSGFKYHKSIKIPQCPECGASMRQEI